jgi:hypothetical protein
VAATVALAQVEILEILAEVAAQPEEVAAQLHRAVQVDKDSRLSGLSATALTLVILDHQILKPLHTQDQVVVVLEQPVLPAVTEIKLQAVRDEPASSQAARYFTQVAVAAVEDFHLQHAVAMAA